MVTIRRLYGAAAALFLLVIAPSFAAEANGQPVAVDIVHAKGTFGGSLTVSMDGVMQKAKTEWSATIRNTSSHKIHRADFCVKAFDASDQQIKPGGEECLLRLWGTNWAAGASLNFKGKQNIRIGDGKDAAHASRYTIEATDVFDNPPNIRSLAVSCPLVWAAALRAFADKQFRPTVLDKDSFTATFAYDGGRVDRAAAQLLKAYTTARAGWTTDWDSFRFDAAALYLREEEVGTCTAEVKMSFAAFGRAALGGDVGWFAVDSNFQYEKGLLDEIEAMSDQVSNADLDKAISQLPTTAPVADTALPPAQLTITSNPDGAEIEVNGEFIGNTPSTITARQETLIVRATKSGYQPWERTLKVSPGDQRTLNIEMDAK